MSKRFALLLLIPELRRAAKYRRPIDNAINAGATPPVNRDDLRRRHLIARFSRTSP